MREESAGDGAGPHTTNQPSDAITGLVHEMRNALNTIAVAAQVIDSKIAFIAGLLNRLEDAGIRESESRNGSDAGAAQGRREDGVA